MEGDGGEIDLSTQLNSMSGDIAKEVVSMLLEKAKTVEKPNEEKDNFFEWGKTVFEVR